MLNVVVLVLVMFQCLAPPISSVYANIHILNMIPFPKNALKASVDAIIDSKVPILAHADKNSVNIRLISKTDRKDKHLANQLMRCPVSSS